MGIYSISDLAELTGVKTHTLRIWEKRYGLLKPQRTGSNIRFYEEEDLRMLRLVQKLNAHGVRISRIAEMSPEERKEECSRLQQPSMDSLHRLVSAIRQMDVTEMDTVLDEAIRRDGFENALSYVIQPAIQEMEAMSLNSLIGEPHEACFRELVKRKTIREIDAMPQHCSGPKVMLFLPSGNTHELDHLLMHYFLRQQGMCVTDLGCDISLGCVTVALQKCNFECILMVNADPLHWQFENFVSELAGRTHLPILVTGKASDENWESPDHQIIIFNDIPATIQFVSRLNENLQHHLS